MSYRIAPEFSAVRHNHHLYFIFALFVSCDTVQICHGSDEVSMGFSGNVKKLSQIMIFRVLTIKIRDLLGITAIILQKLS